MHRVVFIAEIEKAFQMITLSPDDREFVRFRWVDDPFKEDPELKLFRYTRVVFGISVKRNSTVPP